MKFKRTVPIGVAIVGVIAASVVVEAVDALLIEVGAVVGGVVLFGAGYVWYRRQWN